MTRSMLKRHEGLRLRPYSCSAGKRTIGWGWNMTAHPLPAEIQAYLHLNGEITKTMAERLLDISLDTATRQAWDIFPHFGGFTERRQAALIDMIYNLGAGGVLAFKKMRAAIDRGDWTEAGAQALDSLWAKQVGDRAVEVASMMVAG